MLDPLLLAVSNRGPIALPFPTRTLTKLLNPTRSSCLSVLCMNFTEMGELQYFSDSVVGIRQTKHTERCVFILKASVDRSLLWLRHHLKEWEFKRLLQGPWQSPTVIEWHRAQVRMWQSVCSGQMAFDSGSRVLWSPCSANATWHLPQRPYWNSVLIGCLQTH